MASLKARSVRAWLALLALTMSAASWANAELAVTASPSSIIVTPLRSQTVVFTARNEGPQSISNVSVRSTNGIAITQLEITVARPDLCDATIAVNSGLATLSWDIPRLAVGGSAECALRFRALPTTVGSDTLVALRISSSGNTDTHSFDDFARLSVQHATVDRPTDLHLSARPDPIVLERENSTATIELIMSNLGPNPSVGVSAQHDSYSFVAEESAGFHGYDLAASPASPECAFFRDAKGPGVFSVNVGPPNEIAVGQTAICRITIFRLPRAPASSTFSMRIVGHGPGVYDDNEADNVITLPVLFGTTATAVPLSPWAPLLIAVGVLILSVGYRFQSARQP